MRKTPNDGHLRTFGTSMAKIFHTPNREYEKPTAEAIERHKKRRQLEARLEDQELEKMTKEVWE